jgi:hypothetical protein
MAHHQRPAAPVGHGDDHGAPSHAGSGAFERRNDRARTDVRRPAFLCQVTQRRARALETYDFRIDRGEALVGERMDALAVVSGVERQQFGDLRQGEASRLRGADEAQPTDIIVAIAPDAAAKAGRRAAFRRVEQATPLIITHRFNANPGAAGEGTDRCHITA